MGESAERGGQRRSVPVVPPVHVETFATHYTATWKADGLSRFVETVRGIDAIPPTSAVVVDRTDTAGRERRELSDIAVDGGATTYVRVEPPTPWTLSWERRTWPVVSVSGTPAPERCRDIHRSTTDCPGWRDADVETLDRLTASIR